MASGGARPGLAGLLAVVVVACGSGDDTQAVDSADALPTPGADLQPEIEEFPAPQISPVAAPSPSAGMEPDPIQAEEGHAPAPTRETIPPTEGMTANTLATRPARPPCGGSSTCENAGSISGGHGQPTVEIYYDPERDDAIVRWGRALGGIIACADNGDTITTCVAAAPVEQSCKDEFDRLVGLANELAAFDAVFLTAGSPCRPQEGER